MVSQKATLSFGLFLTLTYLSMVSCLATVPLGNSGNYVILAKSGISSTGTTAIVGDLGLYPAAATAITGFPLTMGGGGTYSTTPQVVGKIYAASYTSPTPANLLSATNDMVTAYNNAAGRLNPNFSAVGAGNLNGNTLTQGLYKWTTGVTVDKTVTISGSATDIWIFQIAGNLKFNAGAQIVLAGGALPKNIFWQVAGSTTFEAAAKPKGIVLCKTGIFFLAGAALNGRALAQTAVTLISNPITKP